jgi:hypothetical protein
MAAAAVLTGARSMTAIAEWAADAPQPVREALGARSWPTTVIYAVTSLAHAQASPTRLADYLRGHWRSRTGCTTSGT